MSATRKHYVKAFLSLIKEGVGAEKALSRLKEVMNNRGHGRLWPSVVKALLEALTTTPKSSQTILAVAKEADASKYKALAKGAVVKIDPTLIGGYVLIEDSRRTDQSYKSRLLNWYRKAINN